MSDHTTEIINRAHPHTIKKFELILKYVEVWAQKLLQNSYCNKIVFIDCMANSGEYIDDYGNNVFGTPVKVAKYLRKVAGQYPEKQIELYFSDLSVAKTEHLSTLMPREKNNFSYHIFAQDGNKLIRQLAKKFEPGTHYLLVYDPFDASIDWESIAPFINHWGEVIINHMVSDPMRAIKMVKSDIAKKKYEKTYSTELCNLIPYGSNKDAYNNRITEIIYCIHQNKNRKYFISAFPFFNGKNAIVYNLIHCTGNIEGFKLFKKSAWQTFGGKSSTKNTYGNENQLVFDCEKTGNIKTFTDEYCYYVKDIAEYLQIEFDGKKDVPLSKIWDLLDKHPIFPSEGFRQQIKKELKNNYHAKETRGKISFMNTGKEKNENG